MNLRSMLKNGKGSFWNYLPSASTEVTSRLVKDQVVKGGHQSRTALANSDESKLRDTKHKEDNFQELAEITPCHVKRDVVMDLTSNEPENAVKSKLLCTEKTQAVTCAGGYIERSQDHKSKLMGKNAVQGSVYNFMKLISNAGSHCTTYVIKRAFGLKSCSDEETQGLNVSKYDDLHWKWELSATFVQACMRGQLHMDHSFVFADMVANNTLKLTLAESEQLPEINGLLISRSTKQLKSQSKLMQDRRAERLILTVKCDWMVTSCCSPVMHFVFVRAATQSRGRWQKFIVQNTNASSKVLQNMWKHIENTGYSCNGVAAFRKGPPWELFCEATIQLKSDDSPLNIKVATDVPSESKKLENSKNQLVELTKREMEKGCNTCLEVPKSEEKINPNFRQDCKNYAWNSTSITGYHGAIKLVILLCTEAISSKRDVCKFTLPGSGEMMYTTEGVESPSLPLASEECSRSAGSNIRWLFPTTIEDSSRRKLANADIEAVATLALLLQLLSLITVLTNVNQQSVMTAVLKQQQEAMVKIVDAVAGVVVMVMAALNNIILIGYYYYYRDGNGFDRHITRDGQACTKEIGVAGKKCSSAVNGVKSRDTRMRYKNNFLEIFGNYVNIERGRCYILRKGVCCVSPYC